MPALIAALSGLQLGITLWSLKARIADQRALTRWLLAVAIAVTMALITAGIHAGMELVTLSSIGVLTSLAIGFVCNEADRVLQGRRR